LSDALRVGPFRKIVETIDRAFSLLIPSSSADAETSWLPEAFAAEMPGNDEAVVSRVEGFAVPMTLFV
jgi:hypothetical protein